MLLQCYRNAVCFILKPVDKSVKKKSSENVKMQT
jgi:hypothetical protein